MQHVSAQFTTPDELKLHTETWLPAQDPRAVVVMLHGMAEHIGRYAHVAAWLVRHGYAVYGYDHRGHGRSGGKRGYFDNFEQPVDDLKAYLKLVRNTQADKPIFLFGHSMGALIALDYIIREADPNIAGMIVTSTPLAGDEGLPNFVISAVRTINQVAPDMPITSLDITGMSRDPAVLAAWTTDPLVNFSFLRVRTTLGLVGTIRYIRSHLADITLPALIMHGEGDRIVHASGSVALYNGLASEDKQLKLYPELYHELVNEPEREMVLGDIVAWLDAH